MRAFQREAASEVQAYLESLPVKTTRLADGEWGLKISTEQDRLEPLELSVRISEGLLRVSAFVAYPDQAPPPEVVLRWNRHMQMARFGSTQSGELWVHGELPAESLTNTTLDWLLGTVVLAAWAARAESLQ